MMDTIEKIEKDFEGVDGNAVWSEYYQIGVRILIQIAKELRVLAQKGLG